MNKNNKKEKLIVAKDIMHRYHLTYQTVNHYTNLGLLPLEFKKGNVRFYDACQVKQRLICISRMTKEGYSLNLIRKKFPGA